MVKAFGEVSRELNVLYLVFANWNLFGPCFDVSEILMRVYYGAHW
jgi:hypothetical protein